MSPFIVPARFCGPPHSGNGGWTAGALAALAADPGATAPATVEVTLRRPPPLDTAMTLERGADATLSAVHDGGAVAVARVVDTDLTPVAPVAPAAARAASAGYPGLTFHPFPSCFVCGTGRTEGDGLRIFPGAVEGVAAAAAPWTPHPADAGTDPATASEAVAWAALDCTGGWAGDLTERLMVLGRMTARIDRLPVIGEEHVVVGEHRRTEGRKTLTAASLYDATGALVATAEHTWISVDPEQFGGVAP